MTVLFIFLQIKEMDADVVVLQEVRRSAHRSSQFDDLISRLHQLPYHMFAASHLVKLSETIYGDIEEVEGL